MNILGWKKNMAQTTKSWKKMQKKNISEIINK